MEDIPVYVGLGITLYHLLGSTLLGDNKQQELTSLMLETPLPTRIAVIGYTGQCDTVGELMVQQRKQFISGLAQALDKQNSSANLEQLSVEGICSVLQTQKSLLQSFRPSQPSAGQNC